MIKYTNIKDSWVTNNNILYWLAAISGTIIFCFMKNIVITFGLLFFVISPVYIIMLIIAAYKLKMLNRKVIQIPENLTFGRLCQYIEQNFNHPVINVNFAKGMITFVGNVSKHQLTLNDKCEIMIKNKSIHDSRLKFSSMNTNVQVIYRDTLQILPIIYQILNDAKFDNKD